MERVMEVLRIMVPVLLVIGIGMFCRKRNILSGEGVNTLKNVAVNITLPAVLLDAFATAEYSSADILIPLMMFAVCVAGYFLGKLFAGLLRMPSRFVPFLTTGFEAGMLGYSLYTMLYGPDRVAEFARIDLGQVLFVFTLYKILLGLNGSNRVKASDLVRDMIGSPIILAIAGGVLLGATGLYRALKPSGVAGVIDACTGFVKAPTAALILLTIGYDLVFGDIPWKETLKVILLRLGIMAVLGAVVMLLIGSLWPDLHETGAILVMFVLPAPFVLPVFADDENQRTYVSSVLSVSTLVSIVAFGILAALGI